MIKISRFDIEPRRAGT